MQITLKCQYVTGSVGFPAERIEGLPAPERRYVILDGLVIIAGAEYVVHRDVAELLKQPIYRMLTPAEQEQMAAQVEAAGMAQESVGQGEAPDIPPAVETASSKKKASGG
jgi:hypothetical protein